MAKGADFRPVKVRDLPEGTPFVMISQAMLESPAWSVLGVNHRRLLDFLMIEHTANAGLENGRLKAPRNQLETFGIPRRFIGSTIFETEALGFVDVVDEAQSISLEEDRKSTRLNSRH